MNRLSPAARFVRTAPRPRFVVAALAWMLIAAVPLPASAQEAPADPLDRFSEWRSDPDVYMIAIEVLVVEVNEDKTRDLGLKFGYIRTDVEKIVEGADVVLGRPLGSVQVPDFNAGNALGNRVSFAPRLPGLGLSLSGMDINGGVLQIKLRALLDRGEARVTTRPIVLARNGTEAEIHVISEVPYQDIEIKRDKEHPIVSNKKVGVNMKVKPTILDLTEQTVQLEITQAEVSSISTFITTQNIDRPVLNKTNTATRITLHSGETYQVSSLKGRRVRTFREGIPFLMRVPFFGHFFSSREEVEEGFDILFFVTPHIVPPGRNVLLPYDFLHGQDLIEQGLDLPE